MPAKGRRNFFGKTFYPLSYFIFPVPKFFQNFKIKKMKQLLGTMATICVCLFSNAQSVKVTLKGKIVDSETNTAITAATITTENATIIANDEGNFTLSKLKKGVYSLTISSIGYVTNTFSINAEKDNNLIFSLKRSTFFLQPLEVKSIRASDKAPFTKTNLSKEQLFKTNVAQDLPFMLNQTPSTVVNSDAGNGVGYTNMTIRGVDATRINVTLNGIPYNDAESQGTFWVNMPDFTSSLNSIQIQRGVGTSSNGTGAFGATVNLSTNEFNEKAFSEINNSFGSFNTWKHTVKAGTGLIDNHFTVDARLSKITSDGFVDRASSNLQSFALSAAYLNKKSSLRFNIFNGKEKTYQSWNGLPESLLTSNRTFNSVGTEKPGEPYNNETDNYQQNHYQLFFNHSFNQKLSLNTAAYYTTGAGYYEQYKADASFSSYNLPNVQIGNTTITSTDLVRQLWLKNKFYGQIFSIQYKNKQQQLTLGGGWSTYEGGHFGKVIWAKTGIEKDYEWYNTPAIKKDFNTYLKWETKLVKNVDLFTDLQYRFVRHEMNGFRDNKNLRIDRKFNFINPKIGVTYTVNDLQLYASYAIGNKEPNRNDFEAGTTNQPKSERLNNIELGFSRKNSKYQYGINFYHMQYKNQLVLTGQVNDVGAYTRVNIPNSYRMGIELQGSYVINKLINISGNLTVSRNKIKAFTEFIDRYNANFDFIGQQAINHRNKDIAFAPSVISGYTINILPFRQTEISLLGKYVGRQYLDNTENKARSLNSFYTQDLRIIQSLGSKKLKNCSVIFQLNNVFNEQYEPNGYTFSYIYDGALTTENYFYPMAGTNFMLAFNIKL